jgi:hypothetical protein
MIYVLQKLRQFLHVLQSTYTGKAIFSLLHCLMFSTVCYFLRDDFRGLVDLGREGDDCEGRLFLFK